MPRREFYLNALRVCLAAGVGVTVALIAGSIDLTVYLRAAADVLAGRDPNNPPPGALPWLYPPFAALAFLPLLALPHWAAASLFALASLAALARMAHLIAPLLDRPNWARWWPLLLAAEPVYSTLGFGQVNLLLAWLVVEGFLSRHRWLIGVAVGVKLTPLIFVFPLLLRRDLRGLTGIAIGASGTVALGWLAAPVASTSFWGGSLTHAPAHIGVAYAANQSLTGAALRLLGPGPHVLIVCLLLAAAALTLATIVLVKVPDDLVLTLSISGLLGVLASPISWTHHWIWLLPLIAWCWSHQHRAISVTWGVLLLTRLIWWWPTGGEVEHHHDALGKLTQISWTLLALFTLAALTLHEKQGTNTDEPDAVIRDGQCG